MSKISLCTSIILGSFLSISQAQAENNLHFPPQIQYISIFAGANFLDDIRTSTDYSTDTNRYDEIYRQKRGLTFRGALGGHLNEWLRTEIELGVSTGNHNSIRETVNNTTVSSYPGSGDIRTYTAMANLWADVFSPDNINALRPYLGGGIGLAFVDPNLKYSAFPSYGPQKSSFQFAAQAGAGLNWALNEKIDLGIGYRLNFVDGPKTSQTTTPAGEITTYDFQNMFSHSVGLTMTVKLGK